MVAHLVLISMDSGGIGRATEVQLNTLRRKLGPGCDPCFTQPLVHKEDVGPMVDEKFCSLLNRVNGVVVVNHRDELAEEPAVARIREPPPQRPSSAFQSRGRMELQKAQVPPVGSYSPKADCLASFGKVKHPVPKVPDFQKYTSYHTPRSSPDALLQSQIPSGLFKGKIRQTTFVNMDKQIPRKDSKMVLSDPEAIDPDGVLNGHLHCARFGRFYHQPCFEFRRPERETLIESVGSAHYNVNLETTKAGIPCHTFSRVPRADFVSEAITSHLPDRSFARDYPSLTRFGKLVSPPVWETGFDAPKRHLKRSQSMQLPTFTSKRSGGPSEAAQFGQFQWSWGMLMPNSLRSRPKSAH